MKFWGVVGACLGDVDGGAQGRREEVADGGARLRAQLQAEALAGARYRLQRLLHQRLRPPLLLRPCRTQALFSTKLEFQLQKGFL